MDHLIDRPDYAADADYRRLYGEESNPQVEWLVKWRPLLIAAAKALPQDDDLDALAGAMTEVENAMTDLATKLDRQGWPV